MKRRTFEEWMKLVNQVIFERIGLDSRDLPDQPYHGWYDQGMSYQTAAKKAIED